MQVYNNGLLLYAGAGITSASIPELEWEETSKKLGLLQSLIML
jgi:isochorismate synthase EntC